MVATTMLFVLMFFKWLIVYLESWNWLRCGQVCKCLKRLKDDQYKDMVAISNDYYNVIHFKFLQNEYHRTVMEIQTYLEQLEKYQGGSDEEQHVLKLLNLHIKRMNEKERDIRR